ncbi:MAG: DUF1178 family protein [Hyphomicrobium sp.]
MIKYRLNCPTPHEFDAWFSTMHGFDDQKKSGHLSCPYCGSSKISKAVMAPSVAKIRKKNKDAKLSLPTMEKKTETLLELVKKLHTELKKNADYVGPHFPEEARKMHYEETSQRGIYGEATSEEVTELGEEGIEVFMLPKLPEDPN